MQPYAQSNVKTFPSSQKETLWSYAFQSSQLFCTKFKWTYLGYDSQLSVTLINTPGNHLINIKDLFWLTVLEVQFLADWPLGLGTLWQGSMSCRQHKVEWSHSPCGSQETQQQKEEIGVQPHWWQAITPNLSLGHFLRCPSPPKSGRGWGPSLQHIGLWGHSRSKLQQ
jgi:hypothetical protein